MIRATTPDDKPDILQIAMATRLFESEQIGLLDEMLRTHWSGEDAGDYWLTDELDGKPVGVAYFAPERMTDGTWNLYLIAVHPDHQRNGRGRAILDVVEQRLIQLGARVLLIETAGTDDFDYVRKFYAKRGYDEEARIREFYEAGVDKVVYRKALA